MVARVTNLPGDLGPDQLFIGHISDGTSRRRGTVTMNVADGHSKGSFTTDTNTFSVIFSTNI